MMTDYYQSYAVDYHRRTMAVNPTSFLLPLTKHLSPGAWILDVGCGSGRDMLWLKNYGFSVMGFERAPALAELARKSSCCHVTEGDFTTYDFSNIQADAVIMIGALVHIPYTEIVPALRNITAALRENGIILLTLKEGNGSSQHADGRTFYLYQDQTLRKIFTKFGFNLLDFSRDVSNMGTGETWLRYIIRHRG